MGTVVLLTLFVFNDLNRGDFALSAPQVSYSSISGWSLLINELPQPKKSSPFIYTNYAEVYELCQQQHRKMTVIKNVKNSEAAINKAIADGDYIYLTDNDDRFPDGVSRYYPSISDFQSFYSSGGSGSC